MAFNQGALSVMVVVTAVGVWLSLGRGFGGLLGLGITLGLVDRICARKYCGGFIGIKENRPSTFSHRLGSHNGFSSYLNWLLGLDPGSGDCGYRGTKTFWG